MLANYVGANFSVDWRKVFPLVKDVGEVCMLMNFHQHAALTHIFMQILCW